MPDLINIGTGALLAYQTALNTTSNNIANVNTDGYTRQITHFEAVEPTRSGDFYLGNGVGIESVQRVYNEFLTSDVLNRSSSYGGAETYYAYASRLDSLFANTGSGLQSSIDAFYSAVQDVANNPSALPERQALIGQAEGLISQYQSLNDALNQFNLEVSAQVQAEVSEINSLSSQIAQLNDQISAARADGASSALLDERDSLVKELASKVSINTITQTDGNLNVSLANGATLVNGALSTDLIAFRNEYDPFEMEIGFSGRVGEIAITDRIIGGSLGGALQFREELLESARNGLGHLGAAIGESFNAQHQFGLDLEGDIGQEFFNSLSLTATQSTSNTGTAAVTVSLDDINQLTADEFELSFDGTDWTLTNLTNNSTQVGAGPFVEDGITISIAGAASAGDSFLVSPSKSALDQFSLVMTDPRGIAAASAVRSEQPITNIGTASVSELNLTDASAIPLASDITLTFNPDALGAGVPGFDVTGIAGGPLAYDPSTQSGGTVLALGGIEFRVEGTPEAGDTLGILNNAGGVGDNTNALALANLQQSKGLLNGTVSQQEIYSSIISDVGTKTSRVATMAETEGLLLNQAEQAVASVSGVNLDEEAADLIRFQQAYQAAAQIITIADELFSTLLNATRR